MTEAEEHNEAIFAKFKSEGGDRKIFCILSLDNEARARVVQSSFYSPKQIALKLFQIANQIIHNLNNPPN